MKISGCVEWALHCCVVLTAADRAVPAARPAELHDVSGGYVPKQLRALSRAGLIASVRGHADVAWRGGARRAVPIAALANDVTADHGDGARRIAAER